PVQGEVVFDQVSFSYGDDELVLHDINLHVQPGEAVALVGMTGCGKSTLVNLISRFYDATIGVVSIDGRDVRGATLQSLRSQVSLVSQHPDLFNDTVYNNIAYGNTSLSREDVIRAAQAARADDFIREIPEGYDAVIGERGQKLSGVEMLIKTRTTFII
ncbi:MAG: ATP-binding cassette domain-containing protein, partial [Proteobacteria bacterium]|nr:ATP-binding cassette domain-containing protein [Pseudomonadota bacterium]